VNTATPDEGLKIQMFLNRPDQDATGLMLWNRQHCSYLHYVLIPSEPEHFSLDKLITEALQLLEAPTGSPLGASV